MEKKRSHDNNEARLTVPEMVDAFWKSGVYPTKTGVLKLVQRAVRNALARHKRRPQVVTVTKGASIKLGRDTGERVTVTGLGIGRRKHGV